MKSIIILLFFILPLHFTTCSNRVENSVNAHYYIPFVNESETNIFVYDWKYTYPYDTIPRYKSGTAVPGFNVLNPGDVSQDAIHSLYAPYEKDYNNGILIIFVYDADKYKPNIPAEDALLVRYDLTMQSLNEIDWILTYPPNEKMKAIKMWPPLSYFSTK